jgi:hypothetical protein
MISLALLGAAFVMAGQARYRIAALFLLLSLTISPHEPDKPRDCVRQGPRSDCL